MSDLTELKEMMAKAREEVSKVIIGQERIIDLALVTIFSRSHALIEGVPGIAKTLLVRTLGAIMNGDCNRIQFTPDLMPSDITGTNIFNFNDNEFTLLKGPVFTTFLLGDEINRAPAKTQAALLQSMQERTVSIDGVDHELPYNFTVFATQNPIEFEGTYPLPEAQKDRFLLKIDMDYPEEHHERELAMKTLSGNVPEQSLDTGEVQEVFNAESLQQAHEQLNSVLIKDEIVDYIIKIVRTTRSHGSILVGAGPRATQALILSSRAHAVLNGRDFVTPDDVKSLALPVLGHRIIVRPEYEIEGVRTEEVINQILEDVAIPR